MNRKSRVSPTKENPADAIDATAPAESEDCVASDDDAGESEPIFYYLSCRLQSIIS